MTPKEKAIELIDKYDSTLTYLESKSKAKQCALIAVTEIINSNPHSNPFNTDVHSTMQYWIEVKNELTNL
jgi:hypothetical protein